MLCFLELDFVVTHAGYLMHGFVTGPFRAWDVARRTCNELSSALCFFACSLLVCFACCFARCVCVSVRVGVAVCLLAGLVWWSLRARLSCILDPNHCKDAAKTTQQIAGHTILCDGGQQQQTYPSKPACAARRR